MKVEFLSSFSKDIDKIKLTSLKTSLNKVIFLIEASEDLRDIPNLKKLSGHKSAFRIRIGDYRLGFFFERKKVILARIVPRKDIYKVFP